MKSFQPYLFMLLTILFCNNVSIAQQNQIDSLLQVLKTAKQDTNKVNILNDLSRRLLQTGDYEQAKKQADDAFTLAQKLNFKKGKATNYHIIGSIYYYQGHYPEALKNYFSSLKICGEIGDKKGIAYSYNNIGSIYINQGNYPEALKNFFSSLKICGEIEDKKGIASSYNNIGIVYENQGNYPEALKNYFSSLKIYEEIEDKNGIASSYNNIGNIYTDQGNYHEVHLVEQKEVNGVNQAKRDSLFNLAFKNYFSSLKIMEEIGDKNGIASSYVNLGAAYTSLKKFLEA